MKIPPPAWKGSFGEQLGLVYLHVEPGHASAELEIEARHCNPAGVCHGGALFSAADDTMGAAVHGLCESGQRPTSAQLNVHFARSVRPGDTLRFETHVLSHGRRTAVVESRASEQGGRLVAVLTATYLFVASRT